MTCFGQCGMSESVIYYSRAEAIAWLCHLSFLSAKITADGDCSHEVKRCWLLVSRESNGTPLHYSCLENPMDGGAWWAAVHRVAKSQAQLSDFTFTHWRRKWQPTPVLLPGESQGRGSLVGYRLWGCTESDTTEAT